MAKLVVEMERICEGMGSYSEHGRLVYEHSWGCGLSKNQLQFLADEINAGNIVLPEVKSEVSDDILEAQLPDPLRAMIEKDIREAFLNNKSCILR